MTALPVDATRHENLVARRLEARGDGGQAEALLALRGVVVGGRHRLDSLYAVGGEGAVFLTRDLRDPHGPQSVAKIPLLPLHRPFLLDTRTIRRQRDNLRVEARYLETSGALCLPRYRGTFEFQNPLLDHDRGDVFAEPEPLLLMEKLPGRDLDRWLARMHRSRVPQVQMRRTLDRVAVVLLQGLLELYERGFLYADLRPANLRMMGRPDRIVRLLDAGSLVAVHDRSGRFPHVPAYLPPGVLAAQREGRTIVPTVDVQAVMAGRTLYEVATGLVPRPGENVDLSALPGSNVSPPVAQVIEGLCAGDFGNVRHALRYLRRRAARRVSKGNDPRRISQRAEPRDGVVAAAEPAPPRTAAAVPAAAHHTAAHAPDVPLRTPSSVVVPDARTPEPLWRRALAAVQRLLRL